MLSGEPFGLIEVKIDDLESGDQEELCQDDSAGLDSWTSPLRYKTRQINVGGRNSTLILNGKVHPKLNLHRIVSKPARPQQNDMLN